MSDVTWTLILPLPRINGEELVNFLNSIRGPLVTLKFYGSELRNRILYYSSKPIAIFDENAKNIQISSVMEKEHENGIRRVRNVTYMLDDRGIAILGYSSKIGFLTAGFKKNVNTTVLASSNMALSLTIVKHLQDTGRRDTIPFALTLNLLPEHVKEVKKLLPTLELSDEHPYVSSPWMLIDQIARTFKVTPRGLEFTKLN